ncbi:MAG: hypothetical protein ACJLS2_02445 [Microcella pacifica]
MSAETKAALDNALAAHIQDETNELAEGGVIVTGYALLASYVTAPTIERGTTRYFAEYGESMPHHAAMGLVRHHAVQLDHELVESWSDPEE